MPSLCRSFSSAARVLASTFRAAAAPFGFLSACTRASTCRTERPRFTISAARSRTWPASSRDRRARACPAESAPQVVPDFGGQSKEPHRVRHRRAVLSDLGGKGLLGETQLVLQSPERLCLLDGGQLLALDVLDESELQDALVGNAPDRGRDRRETELLRSAESSLACDDLIAAVRCGPNQDGLYDTAFLNGSGELLQRLTTDCGPGLSRVGVDQRKGQEGLTAGGPSRSGFGCGDGTGLRSRGRRDERGESATERCPLAGGRHCATPAFRARSRSRTSRARFK